ncbi:MAG: hypothetical protein ALECFALPRED_001111, partial [Alectoria fallacina]
LSSTENDHWLEVVWIPGTCKPTDPHFPHPTLALRKSAPLGINTLNWRNDLGAFPIRMTTLAAGPPARSSKLSSRGRI